MNKTQKITVIAMAVVAAVMFATPIALGTDSQQASAFWGGGWHGGGWVASSLVAPRLGLGMASTLVASSLVSPLVK